jgi:hypothetical protein
LEDSMALQAVAFPIAPGKTDEWRKFIADLNGARHADYVASRKGLGLHERAFLQSTPMGDLVIVTLEGASPGEAFGKFVTSSDPFARWFVEKANELHGIDLAQASSGPMPQLVVDSAG